MLDRTGEGFAGDATGPVGGRGIEVGAGVGGGRETIEGGNCWEPSRRTVSIASWAGSASSRGESIAGRGRRPRLANWRSTVAIVPAVTISVVNSAGRTWHQGGQGEEVQER